MQTMDEFIKECLPWVPLEPLTPGDVAFLLRCGCGVTREPILEFFGAGPFHKQKSITDDIALYSNDIFTQLCDEPPVSALYFGPVETFEIWEIGRLPRFYDWPDPDSVIRVLCTFLMRVTPEMVAELPRGEQARTVFLRDKIKRAFDEAASRPFPSGEEATWRKRMPALLARFG